MLSAVRPIGDTSTEAFEAAGGAQGILKRMERVLALDARTVSGKTMGENLANVTVTDDEVIRPLDNPLSDKAAIVIVRGSLAPDGGIIKLGLRRGKKLKFEGRARVFEASDAAIEAMRTGMVKAGDVVVVRGLGVKGGPGMGMASRVVFTIDGAGLGADVAVVTDGQLSGLVNKGLVIGEVTPEAAIGGPLALVADGDPIIIDVEARRADLDVPEAELARRRAALKPPAGPYGQRAGCRSTSDRCSRCQRVPYWSIPARRGAESCGTCLWANVAQRVIKSIVRPAQSTLSCRPTEIHGGMEMAKFGIGQGVKRVEDQRFLTGQGRYVDDIDLPQQAYGVTVLSPHAHARISSVNVSKAQAAPGVFCVLTGADCATDKLGAFTAHPMPEEVGAPPGHRTWLPLLNADKVRYVGDRVAFVVAETLIQARDAAELVEVEYEELPAVVDVEDAAKEGAVKVWDDNQKGNVAFGLMFGNKDATDAAFAKAKHVIKLRVEHNRLAPNAMEPRVAIGEYNAGDQQYTLHTTSQNPHGVRMEMSHIFHVAESQVRVVSPDVGGGFGLKGGPYPDDALVLWASKRIGRPVKWIATRTDSILNDRHGREMVMYGELALDENGKILGLREKGLYQLGALFRRPGHDPGGILAALHPGSL